MPEESQISELKAISYSENGKEEEREKMQGASGTVENENFLGVTRLSSFEMGDIHLQHLKTSVLIDFPDFLNKNDIIGIVGMEILRQAEIIRIEDIDKESRVISFRAYDNKTSDSFDYHFILNTAKNLLFLQSTIQDTLVDFLVDIGSRRSHIGSSVVDNNKITYTLLNTNDKILGIDGYRKDALEGKIDGVKIKTNYLIISPL